MVKRLRQSQVLEVTGEQYHRDGAMRNVAVRVSESGGGWAGTSGIKEIIYRYTTGANMDNIH